MQDRGPAAYLAEFIGTLLLVFFICAVVSLYVVQPSETNPNPFIDWSVIGLVHVFVLFVLIQTLAVVSGAHFNPAVTVAMTALRQIKPADAAHLHRRPARRRASAGALLVKASSWTRASARTTAPPRSRDRLSGGKLAGMLVEFIGTFFLLLAIMGVAVNPRATKEWARSRSAARSAWR